MSRLASVAVTILIGLASCLPSTACGEETGGDLLRSDFDTSTPALAPPWSLRPWFWEGDQFTSAAVWDLVDGCNSHDLPIGAILFDAPWATAYNSFRFDEKRYPNAKEMIAQLHRRDVRVVLWMTNFVNTAKDRADTPGESEDLYAIGKANGYFVNGGVPLRWWKGRGGLIDYTNPQAVAWWHGLMDRALALGIDGWKVDGGAELFALTIRKTSRGTLSLRDYLDWYYRDCLQYGRSYKPDFVTVVRSVDIANSQGLDFPHAPLDAAPLTWVGDQRHSWQGKGLDEAVRSVLRALDRGYPVASSDTGGYQTDPKHRDFMPRLVYLRWAQWNAWTPFFLIGGHDEHRPWKFDAEFLAIFRRYLWLHEELIPFFYSQHVQAHLREGKLMHRVPGRSEFRLGDAFLVGIMENDQPSKEMTFPEGQWLDYWDNRKQYEGGTTRRIAVPEDRSPVFVRLGAIVAMDVRNDATGHGNGSSSGWLTLDCYPGKSASQGVIWNTSHFPPDARRDRIEISMVPDSRMLRFEIRGGAKRDTILRIRWPVSPAEVLQDGKPIPPFTAPADWEKSTRGWRYDGAEQRLWIRLAGVADTTIQVRGPESP